MGGAGGGDRGGGDDAEDDNDWQRQTRSKTSISSQFVMRLPYVFTRSSTNKNVNFIAGSSTGKLFIKAEFVRHVRHS